ncbi:MAG: hypothetical protein JXP73_03645 [Deltaproteobacteria bacterium]|nr:hypothetical protein [Deltaproteobacteria bacterium]
MSSAASDFDLVFAALEQRKVRYLVVGGVAVVLHGYPRFTADLDLIVDFDRANVTAAIEALTSLGYRPRAPVAAMDFADPEKRREWIEDKGVVVFSLWSPEHPATEVDLFVAEPFPFAPACRRATRVALGPLSVPVAAIPDLIGLKEKAGRPKDRDDIEKLREILAQGGGRG